MNDNLILIVGKSATGKSMSLKDIPDHAGVLYANTESNKKLPYRNKFKRVTITDPMQVYDLFNQAETMPTVHTIVIDSLTYLMQMYEMVYVKTATNTMAAWGLYSDFFVNLMQQYVAKSTKNVIFTAHTQDVYNEVSMCMDTFVKVKGSLMNIGIESYFSQIVAAKVLPIKDLEQYKNPLLDITEREQLIGVKHVFQTQHTKATTGERIRGPFEMWDQNETYIDNNISHVLNRITDYYI